jgi:hypothetical protein
MTIADLLRKFKGHSLTTPVLVDGHENIDINTIALLEKGYSHGVNLRATRDTPTFLLPILLPIGATVIYAQTADEWNDRTHLPRNVRLRLLRVEFSHPMGADYKFTVHGGYHGETMEFSEKALQNVLGKSMKEVK